MDNVLMEAATGSTCTLFVSDLAVLYGLLVCSAARQLGCFGGAGRLSGKKLCFFFLIAGIGRSITFLSDLPEAERSNRSLQGENRGQKLTAFFTE